MKAILELVVIAGVGFIAFFLLYFTVWQAIKLAIETIEKFFTKN